MLGVLEGLGGSSDSDLVAYYFGVNTSLVGELSGRMVWVNDFVNGKLPPGRYRFLASWICTNPGSTWLTYVNLGGKSFASEYIGYSRFKGYCDSVAENGTFKFAVEGGGRTFDCPLFLLFKDNIV